MLAAAIPHVSDFASLVGAMCTLQFSYTFPRSMIMIFNMRVGAAKREKEHNTESSKISTLGNVIQGGFEVAKIDRYLILSILSFFSFFGNCCSRHIF